MSVNTNGAPASRTTSALVDMSLIGTGRTIFSDEFDLEISHSEEPVSILVTFICYGPWKLEV